MAIMALLMMLEKEQPAIITKFKLGTIRADLATSSAPMTAAASGPSLTETP